MTRVKKAKATELLGVGSPREPLEVGCFSIKSPRNCEGSFRDDRSGDYERAVMLPRPHDAAPPRSSQTLLPNECLQKVYMQSHAPRTHSARELTTSTPGLKLRNFHYLAGMSVGIDETGLDGKYPSSGACASSNDTHSRRIGHRINFPLPLSNVEKHLLPSPRRKDLSPVAHPLPQPTAPRAPSGESSEAQVNEAGKPKSSSHRSTIEPGSQEAVPLPCYSETAQRIQVSRLETSNQVGVGMACEMNSLTLSAKESPRPLHLLPSPLGGGAATLNSPAAASRLQFLPGGGSPESKVSLPTPTSPIHSPSTAPAQKSLCPRRWRKGHILGQGTFGVVHEGLNEEDGSFFAVKVSSTEDVSSQLQQEVALLSKLEHPNIVRYLGSEIKNGHLCIFLELVRMGSLETILRKYKRFEERTIRTYTRQILHGLEYLHSQKTIHRDIKCANILVDVNGQVKLSDFGVAKEVGEMLATSMKGTPLFMAPEVLTQTQDCYSFSADIWSLGCTVLEMADGRPPWSDVVGFDFLFMVKSGKLPPMSENLSLEGKDFVFRCLNFYANERPTASQLLQHPFVNCASYQELSVPWVPHSQPSLRKYLGCQA